MSCNWYDAKWIVLNYKCDEIVICFTLKNECCLNADNFILKQNTLPILDRIFVLSFVKLQTNICIDLICLCEAYFYQVLLIILCLSVRLTIYSQYLMAGIKLLVLQAKSHHE